MNLRACLLACVVSTTATADSATRPIFETYALEITVADLDESLVFYRDVVGFERQDDGTTEKWAFLALGKMKLALHERAGSTPRESSQVNLNLYVDDLEKTIATWRKRGAAFLTEEPEPFVLGNFIRLRDPAGNSIHLLKVTTSKLPPVRNPRIFNVGLSFDDLDAAETLFSGALGIPVSSRDYLPKTLVLEKVGAFSIVLHKKDSIPGSASTPAAGRPRVVFATNDLDAARSKLRSISIVAKNGGAGSFWGIPSLTFQDSQGHAYRIAEVPAFALPARAREAGSPTIADLSWIAGSWTRSDKDGVLRETWSQPLGGQMMGMFQWIKDGRTWINEFCTITETDGEIAFRLRHFDGRMVGWETKDAPFYYPLRSIVGRKAIFENPMRNSPRQLIFSRPSDDTLQIDVVGYKDGKEDSRWEFEYHRAK